MRNLYTNEKKKKDKRKKEQGTCHEIMKNSRIRRIKSEKNLDIEHAASKIEHLFSRGMEFRRKMAVRED